MDELEAFSMRLDEKISQIRAKLFPEVQEEVIQPPLDVPSDDDLPF